MAEWTGRSGDDTFQAYNQGRQMAEQKQEILMRDFTVPKPWEDDRKTEIAAKRLTVLQRIATLGAKLYSAHEELGIYNAQMQDSYHTDPSTQPTEIQPFLPGLDAIHLPVAAPHEKPIHFSKPYTI